MKRFMNVFMSLAVGAALAACGSTGGGGGGGGGGGDMATGGGAADMAMQAQPDMAKPIETGANTGEECGKPADCAKGTGPNQNPQCLKNVGMPPNNTMYPGGYCTTPCRMSRNDPATGLNSDCPGGESTCVGQGASGLCFKSCQLAADCNRMGYGCGFVGGETATCVPAGECDAMRPCKDPMTSCVFYSPDNSYGNCEAKCDVFKQDCMPPQQGTVMCLADPDDGQQNCVVSVNPQNMDGADCRFLNDCAPGLACRNDGGMGKCRPYCGGPMDVMCMNGKMCVDLSMAVKKTVVGICGG